MANPDSTPCLVRCDERGIWSSLGILTSLQSEPESPFPPWLQKLMRAVFQQALRELERGLDPMTDWEIDAAWEVIDWASDNTSWPFSFEQVVTVCGRSHERLRPLFLAIAKRLPPRPGPGLLSRPVTDWSTTILVNWEEDPEDTDDPFDMLAVLAEATAVMAAIHAGP